MKITRLTDGPYVDLRWLGCWASAATQASTPVAEALCCRRETHQIRVQSGMPVTVPAGLGPARCGRSRSGNTSLRWSPDRQRDARACSLRSDKEVHHELVAY